MARRARATRSPITQWSKPRAQNLAWLSLKPVTGRTHQLRAHMAHIQHPIVGDPKYFNMENWQLPGGMQNKLHLLARRIAVPHPRGGRIDVTAPLPDHMQQIVESAGARCHALRSDRGGAGGDEAAPRHGSALAALVLAAAPVPRRADDIYTIMKPEPGARSATSEPWLAPKYKSPRGTIQRAGRAASAAGRDPPHSRHAAADRCPPNRAFAAEYPPPVVPGAGIGGRETSQDRATRCTHQAGMYGAQAGDRSSYITTCVNQ